MGQRRQLWGHGSIGIWVLVVDRVLGVCKNPSRWLCFLWVALFWSLGVLLCFSVRDLKECGV